MREIKFRTWDEVYKKFVFSGGEPMGEFWLKVEGGIASKRNVPVMQFAGLKDKNGKEIYEGDIVSLLRWKPHIYQVGFDRGSFCFFKGDDPIATDAKYFEDCEIIGNVWENPHLLKGDDSKQTKTNLIH
jgi:YopX protein